MNNPILLLSPIVNVIVTAIFAGVVLGQYLRRHRAYQLYWAIALSMAFLATLAYVFMLVAQPTSSIGLFCFHVYYVLGAALMPAWLGMGSIALVTNTRVTYISLTILYILSALATVLIAMATVDMHALSQIAGTPGSGILQPGAWLATIIILNTLGVLAVAGVAISSGWQLLRRQGTRHLLWANVLILVGDLINAAAGSLARFSIVGSKFWLIMAFGWTVLFIGVLLASQRRSQPISQKPIHTAETEFVAPNKG